MLAISTLKVSSAMGDLRVWVDGVERVVRGANEETTCENILVAVANATGKLGRFALLEKWRDLERILPREAKPIQCLRMWGDQAREVKFVLKLMEDKTTHGFSKLVDVDQGNQDGNLVFSKDPFYSSSKKSSLEKIVANQSGKLKRLERDMEIIQLRIDSCVEDEESYLYFTKEEIDEDRITKLGQVLKLQSKELATEQNCFSELAKESRKHENLRQELRDQRDKLDHLDVHISDLENVGKKIFAMRSSHNKKPDSSERSTNGDGEYLEELAQEISVTREELMKQRELAERQVEEVTLMKKSLADVEHLSRRKTSHLLTIIGDASPEVSLSYYDLEKHLALDEGSVACAPSVSRYSNTSSPVANSQSSFQNGTPKSSPREKFLLDELDALDDQGVFV